MKEKNKKIKFKKWYLMPIFVVVFLCVFGFSIVKPVKAEYYTENPTFVANTQYAFNVQAESPINPSSTFMFPQEIYNYTEVSNGTPTYLAIDTFNPFDDTSTNYGYIEQTHEFIDSENSVYDYLTYYSECHFKPIFTTYDTYLNFVNEEFFIIPSLSTGYSNFDFTKMPYFNSLIRIQKDINNNQYLKLVSCEFDVVYLTIGANGVEEVVVPFSYDFEEDPNNEFDNVNLLSKWGNETYYIVNSNNSENREAGQIYPYRLVDFLIGKSVFLSTQEMLLIRNFKLFTYIAPRTQVTGIDSIFTLCTSVTKLSDVSFDSIDYKNENYSIELLNVNLTASQWGQFQFDRIGKNIENVNFDFTSWLITSVGSFMNAELFPGFAIGGIFAVMVAFPLVIWFLKIVLGG